MISPVNIWISFILPHCPCSGLLWVVGCKGNMAWELMHINNLQNMEVHCVPICDRSKNRALDRRRETGTSTFPSVQIYQCHTPVKFSVGSTVSVTWGLSARSSDCTSLALRPRGSLGKLSSQSLRLCLCHQVLQNSRVYFPLPPDSSNRCPGPCLVLWLFAFKMS